jgi:hypothetical protein
MMQYKGILSSPWSAVLRQVPHHILNYIFGIYETILHIISVQFSHFTQLSTVFTDFFYWFSRQHHEFLIQSLEERTRPKTAADPCNLTGTSACPDIKMNCFDLLSVKNGKPFRIKGAVAGDKKM